MKYRDPETGEFKELYTKAADTLPVGTVVDFDDTEVPAGWEQAEATDDYSTEETFTGKYWIDGKKIYRKVILSTVGNINSILGSLNIEHTINLFGKANSNYNQKWSIPNIYHIEPKYNNTVTYKGEIPEIQFWEFYRETDAVEVIIEYTKTTK